MHTFVDFTCYIDRPMPSESIPIEINYVACKIFSRSLSVLDEKKSMREGE